ncbi:hypothetical protein, partial [Pseudomonas savastanoi]|uniref:hypothetical protein n=1 Tax=Pseudomonas savastanoi TaxID=29438 RepID=UPI001CC212DC
DTVFRTYLAAQSSRFRLGGVAAGKQLFGVNPHQYWLPAHDGNFWDSGLQPLLKKNGCQAEERSPPLVFRYLDEAISNTLGQQLHHLREAKESRIL